MSKKMLIDAAHAEETRVVVVDGTRVEEFDFESQNRKQLRGNIYLAKVTRVEPSLQAAFIEYGGNRHGFLAFNEIHPDYYKIPEADREALMREEAEDFDDHEPRAFGDNIAKWGSSLILIESGGYKEDTEKQFIRKLNFVAILTGLQAISEQSYTKFELKTYEAIPNNDRYIFDLLIRNAEFVQNGKTIIKDIGINLSEKNINNATDFMLSSVIEDLGDLSTFWGLKEIDAKGLKVSMLSDFPEVLQKYKVSEKEIQNQTLKLDETASFLLTKDKEVKYIILNGQIK
jgi:Ribonuclease G/E